MTDLAKLPRLSRGNHDSVDDGACVMELVSYIAGEPWSDHPTCACPVLTSFMVAWNDVLPDDQRDALLRPLVPLLVGTRSTPEVERRRSMMAADWLIREHTPAWLRLAGLTTHADTLTSMPEITDAAQLPSFMPALTAARKDAYATWPATWGIAAVAARVAAVAEDAAGDAAKAAVGAEAAAWAAAEAGTAARIAVGSKAVAECDLTPTRLTLQQSALHLVRRMIAVGESA